jgi:hypothetical protein
MSSWIGQSMTSSLGLFRAATDDPADTLKLQGGRFEVRTTWTTPDGTTGSGRAVPLTSDSGYFWFFDPTNAEMVVKALNGCGVDGSWWVFAGGLTDVQVRTSVTDTITRDTRVYFNPQGTAFQPILDTKAFAACSASERLAKNPEEPSASAPPALPRKPDRSRAACVAGPEALCLDGGRFKVEAAWETSTGSGSGTAVALTANSGYFWFFDSGNVELLVKVLDGCAIDARHWFFAGGLTDVRVVLTVTDTASGEVKTYTNALGSAFLPIQDTSAFERCP